MNLNLFEVKITLEPYSTADSTILNYAHDMWLLSNEYGLEFPPRYQDASFNQTH